MHLVPDLCKLHVVLGSLDLCKSRQSPQTSAHANITKVRAAASRHRMIAVEAVAHMSLTVPQFHPEGPNSCVQL
eukprot:1140840-Pelagomonas_calceolata.AAC.4